MQLGSTEVSKKFQKLLPSDVREWSVENFATKFLPQDFQKDFKKVIKPTFMNLSLVDITRSGLLNTAFKGC